MELHEQFCHSLTGYLVLCLSQIHRQKNSKLKSIYLICMNNPILSCIPVVIKKKIGKLLWYHNKMKMIDDELNRKERSEVRTESFT